MTQQDARERAWQEVSPKYSHMPPNALVNMFREFFDKTWDAAKREDEQRIAALVEVLVEVTAALGGAIEQLKALNSEPSENAKRALRRGIEQVRALAGSEESGR